MHVDDLEMDFTDADDDFEVDTLDYDDFDDDVDDIDDVLDDLLMDAADDDEDLDERRRRRRRRRGKKRRRVRTAKGRSLYKPPTPRSYVTQKQFKAALSRVSSETKRNALGIKSVNTKLGRLDTRVDGVVTVNKVQSKRIRRLDQQQKVDATLAFVEGFAIDKLTNELKVSPYDLYRAALKGGLLGESKGALSNPLVLGGIGAVLRPELGILSKLTS